MISSSRRSFLAALLTTPAVIASCATPGAESDFPQIRLKLPNGSRVRGVNIGPGGEDWNRGDSAWTGLWKRWEWDTRIKNEIDDAVALGANCIRLFGNTHVLSSNEITHDLYFDRWHQFLDYTKSSGILAYPCGGDLSHWGNTPLSEAKDIYQRWAELLAEFDHVIGVDVTNEAHAQSRVAGGIAFDQPESWLYTVKTLGDVLRSVAKKPVTHSRGLKSPSPESWEFGSPETDAISDFLDVHAYLVNSPSDADVLYSSPWGKGKQLLIGEFGANGTLDARARSSVYESVSALIGYSEHCVGGLAWSIYDTGNTPEGQYGLIDEMRRPREDIAMPFREMPLSR